MDNKDKSKDSNMENKDKSENSNMENKDKSTIPKSKKNKKNRCAKCNKKLGLIPFNCKCGNLFCSKCRYPESHECTFDFRADAKEKILKENPVIKCNKINPI